MNQLIYLHGMNQTDQSADDLLRDWNTHLFGKPQVIGTDMVFWGDLSVSQQPKFRIPDPFWCELYKLVTDNHFLGDCFNFFYNQDIRTRISHRFFDQISSKNPDKTIVVAHSLGTVIAYAALSKVLAGRNVFLFTIGSPLGLAPVQAELRKYLKVDRLVIPPCVQKWQNFSDPRDLVALTHNIAGDYSGDFKISDVSVRNPAGPEQPHSIDGYLQVPQIRDAVKSVFNS